MDDMNWAEEARSASKLTPEQCAVALGCSRQTYMSREKRPGTFTIDEVRAFGSVCNRHARKIIRDALSEVL